MITNLQWNHPVKGRVIEEVCADHEAEVFNALKTLGIGCTGRFSDSKICYRCIYDGYSFRDWVDRITGESL